MVKYLIIYRWFALKNVYNNNNYKWDGKGDGGFIEEMLFAIPSHPQQIQHRLYAL